MAKKTIIESVEKYGVHLNLHDFGQDAFAEYQMQRLTAERKAFIQFSEDGNGVTAQAPVRSAIVRTAISLEIISGIQIEDIGDMKPYVVQWIADEIKKHVTNVVSAPPNPN
jgi:acetate kinase